MERVGTYSRNNDVHWGCADVGFQKTIFLSDLHAFNCTVSGSVLVVREVLLGQTLTAKSCDADYALRHEGGPWLPNSIFVYFANVICTWLLRWNQNHTSHLSQVHQEWYIAQLTAQEWCLLLTQRYDTFLFHASPLYRFIRLYQLTCDGVRSTKH